MYRLKLIHLISLAWWGCAVFGVVVSEAALQWRDAAPSMSWAYARKETDQAVIITVRDFKFDFTESENGALIAVAGPVAWPAYGKPSLPIIILLFEVPADENYEVSWNETAIEERPVATLAPVVTPGIHSVSDGVYRTIMTSLRDDIVYEKSAYWPETIVRHDEARGAGRRFMRVEIFPFQYHPVLGLLRMHRGLKVVLSRVERKPNE